MKGAINARSNARDDNENVDKSKICLKSKDSLIIQLTK